MRVAEEPARAPRLRRRPSGVAAVDAVAVWTAGACGWKARTPAVPATVAARTMGIGASVGSVSEGERLEVDPALRHAGALELGGELPRERVGTAQVDLAAAHVGDEPAQGVGVERHLVARADELDEAAAAAADLVGDLVAQDEVGVGRAAQQDGDVGLLRELLQQGEDRRGADAGADEQQPVVLGACRR